MRSSRLGLGCAALAVAAFCLAPSPAGACSICRCGDPTFNALGTDVYASGNFRVALDWERFEKEQGAFEPGVEAAAVAKGPSRLSGQDETAPARESQVENRFTTTLSYAFADRANLVARLPWTSRRLSADSEIQSSRDLADPEIYGL